MSVKGKMREVLVDDNKCLIKPTTYTTNEVKHHVINLRTIAGRKAVVALLVELGHDEKKREWTVSPTGLSSDESNPPQRARTRE
jgi:hypothetical protein